MKIDSKISFALFSVLMTACVHQNAAPPGKKSQMLFEVKAREGETLGQIEESYDVPQSTIQRVNGLSSPTPLKAGQILYIPASEKALQSADLRGRSRLLPKDAKLQAAKGRRDQLYTEHRQLSWPVDGHVGSGFGMRHGKEHAGIDILSDSGEPIRAAHAGTVEFVGWKRGYGQTLIIRHEGFRTLYAHCSKILAKAGEQVDLGEKVAIVGNSGNAEGIHLHFEYHTLAGKALDPMPHFTRALAH